MSFAGRTVVVTGGSGAVGSVVSRRFVEVGARTVIAAGRGPPRGAGSPAGGGGGGARGAGGRRGADEESVRALFAWTSAEHGGPHVLINAAGGFRFGPVVEEMEESDWDGLLRLNLKSAFLTLKHVLPYMRRQGYGRIVSIAARSGLRGDPMVAHYSVSKGGVILLTQSVAEEVKEYDITVNAVLPSIVNTAANREAMPDADPSRWVQPDDLASVMLFLASEEARAVSGAAIPAYHKA